MSQLVRHPTGNYRFLPGIAPYSCGVVAEPGHEIVRVTLRETQPWRDGFAFVDDLLALEGRQRTDLCAMELRSPQPFTMQGFIDFNREYCAVLEAWSVFVAGANPIARTNVCPLALLPGEPALHAFCFVRPSTLPNRRTFIVAGAGELLSGVLVREGIICLGDISPAAIAEKARYVCEVMEDRLLGLGGTWDDVTAVNAYTVHPLDPLMEGLLLARMPAALRHGVHWHFTRPPVIDIEYEMDLRGIATEWSR